VTGPPPLPPSPSPSLPPAPRSSPPPGDRGTPAIDNPPGAFLAIYRLLLRSLAKRGRLIGLGLVGLAGVLVALAIGASKPFDPLGDGAHFIDHFGLSVLVPVTTLVFASASIGDATDDGTLVYLWLRPVKRSRVALAAFAASLTICLPLVGVPLVVAAALVGGGGELISGTAVSVAVAVVGYCGLFTAWGVRVRRALPWGLAYILLWEGFVARAGKSAGRLALLSYSQSVLSEYTGVGLRLAESPLAVGIIVPIVVAGLAVAYASHRLNVQDVA